MLLFLHLQCRGGPFDLHRRLGLAQLPYLHHLLGLVRAELWAELQLDLGRDLHGPPTLNLPRGNVRAQSAGLVLVAPTLTAKRMPREHEPEHGFPVCGSAQPSRLRPSPRRPPAHVQKIPAWAPCLRPLTPSTEIGRAHV